MTDFFYKLENIRHNAILTYITIAFIFILDLLTPLGFAVWVLYIMPLLMSPYKTLDKSRIYLTAALITLLLWACYFSDAPGTAPKIALFNRIVMSFILWLITYVQVQRANTHHRLIKQEETAKRSEERFRTAQEHSLDGFTLFRPFLDSTGQLDFRFTFENVAAGKLIGKEPEKVIGHTLLEMFPSSIDTQFYQSYKKVYETGIPLSFEDYYSGEGVEKWFRMLVVPSGDEIAVISQDITEKKMAEEKLKESEQRFRNTLDNMLEGCAIIDFNWNYIYVNEVSALHAHREKNEIIGKSVFDVVPGIEKSIFFEACKKCMDERKEQRVEASYTFEDGSKAWYEFAAQPVPEGVFVLSTDITERKDIEENLRRSEERFRIAQEVSPDGFMLLKPYLDKNGDLVDFIFEYENHAIAKMNGTDPEKIIGKRLLKIFPGNADTIFFKNYKTVYETGKPIEFEDYYKGEAILNDRWFRIVTVPTIDGIAILAQDITERKKFEESLRESEERFRQTFEKAATGIAHILPDGRWLKVNDKYCQTMGYSRDELPKHTFMELTHPDDLERDLEMRRKLLNGEIESFSIEKRYIRKDGNIKWAILTCSIGYEKSTGLKYMISVLEDITELKFLQQANERNLAALEKEHKSLEALSEDLRRHQLRFERAEALANTGSWIMDVRTGVMEISDELTKILGLDQSVKKMNVSDYLKLVHPEDQEKMNSVPSEPHKKGKAVDMEYRIVRPSGEVRYIHGISEGAAGGENKTLVRFGAAMDITEGKLTQLKLEQALNSLKESETRLRDAQRLAHIGSYAVNYENYNVEFSEELYRIFGWDPETKVITYEDVISSVHPDDKELLTEAIKKSIEEKTSIELDYRIVTPGGEVKYVYTKRDPVFDDHGKLTGTFGTSMDITSRKLQEIKLEEALIKLQESESRLIDAQKLAKIGNYTIDFKNNGKMEWSDEMYNIWEVDKTKPFPTVDEVWKLVHPDDWKELKSVLTNNSPENEKVETEFRILFPDKSVKHVHIVTRVIFDEAGNLIKREGVEMDITDRKLAQIRLERTLQELKRSNHELEQFAYIASHDLQEPLRMITNYISLLERKYKDQFNQKALEFIRFAVDGSKRMSNLIKDLLTYSRVTTKAGELREVDLNEIFNDVMRDLQILVKEKNAMITSTKLPAIKADPTQMRQLLQNLIGNAIKFQGDRTPEIMIRAKEIENGFLFSIKDNGIGIDSQFYDRIFQVFQRLHERDKYEGTGIGLAVCKRIVERHGGKIRVESEPGKGTTFYFTIHENNESTDPEIKDDIEILSA